ncbi:MAG: ribonuclease HII [Gemmatimonadetes bacterium]|nr:ribonuclease HII [Gemmatimonadota bacterium]
MLRASDAPRGAPSATRLQNPLEAERAFWSRGFQRVAGVDEVGRGPLAGPVVAVAVILPTDVCIAGADDSKRLSPSHRVELAAEIVATALTVGIGAASSREIDTLNIRVATALAMQRAVARLRVRPDHLLVDGLPVPELGRDFHTGIVGGDRTVHSISCASIVAKVTRDRLMDRLAVKHPGFGWERNKGYGTPEHLAGLRARGPTRHHRFSFRPVGDLAHRC